MISSSLLCAALLSLGLTGGEDETGVACTYAYKVIHEAHVNNLDPEVLAALIFHESRWNPRVVSKSGACGLTQVLPHFTGNRRTGVRKYNCRELFNPNNSIEAGAKTLAFWDTKNKGNMAKALCQYNAGYRCSGPNPSRKGMNYSRKVRNTAASIRRFIEENYGYGTCGRFDSTCDEFGSESSLQDTSWYFVYQYPASQRRYRVHVPRRKFKRTTVIKRNEKRSRSPERRRDNRKPHFHH